ncbi:uncharacterized protein LOC129764275 [Toxorhynchites rutilus septentrionalis]|uniref:uncharacterized protein LOC129764275 n=1 Tax=Toxorhynchites rutilus septentrionalis TaxID=329112 RepID=UPI002478B06C|nr:uncharacterized protein LOC129764275 [Toxorhynchites rutilus septentrionalis]
MVDTQGFAEQLGSSNTFRCSMAKVHCFLVEGVDRQKTAIKWKLEHNKTEMSATGGGPNTMYSFNELEETIIRILSLERAVNHNGVVFGIQSSGISTKSTSADDVQGIIPCDEERNVEEIAVNGEPMLDNTPRERSVKRPSNIRGRERANKRNIRKVMLENQTADLCEIKRHVSDCARYARKSYFLYEKRLQLEENKFNFKKHMMLQKEKYRAKQLQYQMQLLQYKKQKLNFKMGRITDTKDADDDSKSTQDDSDE